MAQSDVVTDLVAHRHGVSLEIWWLTDMVSPWRSGGSQRCSLIGDLMAHRDGVPKKIWWLTGMGSHWIYGGSL